MLQSALLRTLTSHLCAEACEGLGLRGIRDEDVGVWEDLIFSGLWLSGLGLRVWGELASNCSFCAMSHGQDLIRDFACCMPCQAARVFTRGHA